METTSTGARASAPQSRRALLLVAKLAVSALLIGWILHRAGLREVWNAAKHADPLYVAISFCLFPLGWIVSVARWRLLLGALGGESEQGVLLRSLLVRSEERR